MEVPCEKVVADPDNINQCIPPKSDVSDEELRRNLLTQIEFYLSPKNVEHDVGVRSMLDSQWFIPVSGLANLMTIKILKSDLLVDVIRGSKKLELHPDGESVRFRRPWSDFQEYRRPRRVEAKKFALPYEVWKTMYQNAIVFSMQGGGGKAIPQLMQTEDIYKLKYSSYLFSDSDRYDDFMRGILTAYPCHEYPIEVKKMIMERKISDFNLIL